MANSAQASHQKTVGSRSAKAGDNAVTVMWGLVFASTLVFIAIASAVSNGALEQFDRDLLLALRVPADTSNAWGPVWFEEAAAELTALGGYTILILLSSLIVAFLLLNQKRAAALFLTASLVTGSVLSNALKLMFARPRPDLVDHLDRTFTSSFPSAHAMVSMLAYLTLAAVAIRFIERNRVRRYTVISAIVIAILIGVSRVYLGVHWPSDVIAGWAVGLAWACLCWLAAHYWSQSQITGDAGHSRM